MSSGSDSEYHSQSHVGMSIGASEDKDMHILLGLCWKLYLLGSRINTAASQKHPVVKHGGCKAHWNMRDRTLWKL